MPVGISTTLGKIVLKMLIYVILSLIFSKILPCLCYSHKIIQNGETVVSKAEIGKNIETDVKRALP